MTDFKVGDKAVGIKHHDGEEVTITSTPATSGGMYIRAKNKNGYTGLFLPRELKLVKPEPKFKAGDWVKVHGRDDKWDGTLGTVQKVSLSPYGAGNLYTIHKNDVGDVFKKSWSENVLRFFEDQLEATKAPKPAPKFKVGDWVEVHGWGGSWDGRVLQISGFTAPYYRFEGEAKWVGFSAKYLKAAEAPKPATSSSLKIYLAGPMSGIEHYNFPAFFTAARKLREAGHEVFNPAENDMATGFNALGMEGHEASEHGFSLRNALKADLTWICENANAIALLDGWEDSKGVKAELALADALGIETAHYAHYLKEATV